MPVHRAIPASPDEVLARPPALHADRATQEILSGTTGTKPAKKAAKPKITDRPKREAEMIQTLTP